MEQKNELTGFVQLGFVRTQSRASFLQIQKVWKFEVWKEEPKNWTAEWVEFQLNSTIR